MPLELPASLRDEWCVAGTRTTDGRVMIATVTAETTVFEPTADAAIGAFADRTGETNGSAPSIPPRSLLTVDLTVSPPLSSLGVEPADALGMAAPRAADKVADVLEDDGIAVGDEDASETFQRADGSTARRTVRALEYPIAAPSADGNSGSESDGSATIDAELHLGVWPTEASFGLAGGIVPLSTPADGDVQPERDRETVRAVMERTGLENGDRT